MVPSYSEALLINDGANDVSSASSSVLNVERIFGSSRSVGVHQQTNINNYHNNALSNNRLSRTFSWGNFLRRENSFSRLFNNNSNSIRSSSRYSWSLLNTSTRPGVPRMLGLPVSLTRLSLHNGQVVYRPLPVWESPEMALRNNNNNNNNNKESSNQQQVIHIPDDSPPAYEEALRVSRPLVVAMRRSVTDRAICRRSPERRLSFEDNQPRDHMLHINSIGSVGSEETAL